MSGVCVCLWCVCVFVCSCDVHSHAKWYACLDIGNRVDRNHLTTARSINHFFHFSEYRICFSFLRSVGRSSKAYVCTSPPRCRCGFNVKCNKTIKRQDHNQNQKRTGFPIDSDFNFVAGHTPSAPASAPALVFAMPVTSNVAPNRNYLWHANNNNDTNARCVCACNARLTKQNTFFELDWIRRYGEGDGEQATTDILFPINNLIALSGCEPRSFVFNRKCHNV